jgi:hypothetical protein
MDRKSGRNDIALRTLRDAQLRYTGLPGSSALDEWIKILDPPKTKPKPKPKP